MKNRVILAAIFFMAASFVSAQVKVEDRKIPTGSVPPPQNQVNSTSAAEMYYQLQLLQQEVMQLRGLVEEQAHQLKRLKQQRLDDYVDLDRRLSQLSNGGTAPAGQANTSAASAVKTSTGNSSKEELQGYKSAYSLVTKDLDQAEKAFLKYLDDYPSSSYAANSVYMLGEIYLRNNDVELARQWFTRVIDDYPQHYRVGNAKLKLGTVYHMLGEKDQAQRLWTEVVNSDSNAAAKAQENLDTYFP